MEAKFSNKTDNDNKYFHRSGSLLLGRVYLVSVPYCTNRGLQEKVKPH